MKEELERPLGKDRRTPRRRKPSRVSSRGILLAAVALVVVGASGAVAFRQSPFRSPPLAVVSAPEIAEKSHDTPQMAAAQPQEAEAAGGAKIIHVSKLESGAAEGGIVVRSPSELNRNSSISHLPDRALIEESETGPLPVRGSDGRRPFDAYARPWSGTGGPHVALVIGGLGLSQTGTQRAIETLPPEVTLAFAPQGNSLDRWMQAARRAGHEIVMQVPLEPYDFPNVNPGRNTLTISAPRRQNLRELRWALSRITNYTGIMNYMGARFTANAEAVDLVMQELARRGLMYLDDGTSARSVAGEVADREGVPFARGDIVIDTSRDRGEILKKLGELERTARAEGSAIGTGSAFEVTVDTVSAWVGEARKRGVEIVPLSALADDPEHNEIANGN